MSNIEYPYMPDDRHLKYVPANHPFMIEAQRARNERSGDPLFPVGGVVVKDGEVVARAGNGFNRGAGAVHVCPRFVAESPSGQGYELCDLHDPPGHCEQMLMQVCEEQGIDVSGGDVYLYGHWWACKPCWDRMIAAGVRDVYVIEDAHETFTREKVYGERLGPHVKTVSVEGGSMKDLEEVSRVLVELGLTLCEKEAEACARIGADGAQCFLRGACVYEVLRGEKMARQVGLVFRQL